MDDEDSFNKDDDFEKLLDSFINSTLDDDSQEEPEEKLLLNEQGAKENEEASAAFEDELAATFAEARTTIEENDKMPTLGSEETELAQAFINFQASINKLADNAGIPRLDWQFEIDDLHPNYKPSVGRIVSNDLVNGWDFLCRMFPDNVGCFPVSASDEEFLNFAEKISNQDLQLAIISYVEILIDIESCELSYQAKLLKYQEKHIRRIMYEEYLACKERQQRFIEAVKKKNFPIDAERLITNYFRVSKKDIDGAFKALTTNPAIFAPIDISKIKPRWFGLVKVTPKDGIRVNMEIGKFMKKLKV